MYSKTPIMEYQQIHPKIGMIYVVFYNFGPQQKTYLTNKIFAAKVFQNRGFTIHISQIFAESVKLSLQIFCPDLQC